MERIYLKIVDLDNFDIAEISNEKEATHSVKVSDKDYESAMAFLSKYLNKIHPYLPFDPELSRNTKIWN